jgi:alpha-tubulin suppressor-like RCC1 family protein
LKVDSSVACWGSNSNGQATPPAGTFSQISAGLRHTIALSTTGGVWEWGEMTRQPL